ncbi:MAG: DNA polymerase IV [Paramuribaculum sp.]|nr:DNA polymerase IV [Paramuribaculum sp.]
MHTERKIIHVDMDAFFASVEQRDHPELRGLPVAVGHAEERGVVAAASYEARKFGVRSAMSSAMARRLCPSLIFVHGNMARYKEVSGQIHEIFRRYTDLIEPLSLDEAFLDVTVNKPGIDMAVEIARRIKAEIREKTNLVASAGVSYNKFLAKIASDWRKPDGLCTIHPSRAYDFISRLPVESFWGVGPVTAKKMHSLGIHTGTDLREWSLEMLVKVFGKQGLIYYDFARGIDMRPVQPYRERKSIGCEHTLERDISTSAEIDLNLSIAADELAGRIARKGFRGTTLTLKVKFHDFTQITRSVSGQDVYADSQTILDAARRLAEHVGYETKPVRLIGLSVSNKVADPATESEEEVWRQLYFKFDNPE